MWPYLGNQQVSEKINIAYAQKYMFEHEDANGNKEKK